MLFFRAQKVNKKSALYWRKTVPKNDNKNGHGKVNFRILILSFGTHVHSPIIVRASRGQRSSRLPCQQFLK